MKSPFFKKQMKIMKKFNDNCDYLVVGTGSISDRHISNLRLLFPKSKIGNISASGKSLKRRNKIAIDLFSKKYRKRVIKQKKGKGSFKRRKK